MKRATALRIAQELARRVQAANGIIGTPDCRREAYRIRRLWLFGSTAKGSESPNDVDILVEGHGCGRFQRVGVARTDKAYLRKYGARISLNEEVVALTQLRQGLKLVRFHRLEVDGNLAHPRILLYPRNDLGPT